MIWSIDCPNWPRSCYRGVAGYRCAHETRHNGSYASCIRHQLGDGRRSGARHWWQHGRRAIRRSPRLTTEPTKLRSKACPTNPNRIRGRARAEAIGPVGGFTAFIRHFCNGWGARPAFACRCREPVPRINRKYVHHLYVLNLAAPKPGPLSFVICSYCAR